MNEEFLGFISEIFPQSRLGPSRAYLEALLQCAQYPEPGYFHFVAHVIAKDRRERSRTGGFRFDQRYLAEIRGLWEGGSSYERPGYNNPRHVEAENARGNEWMTNRIGRFIFILAQTEAAADQGRYDAALAMIMAKTKGSVDYLSSLARIIGSGSAVLRDIPILSTLAKATGEGGDLAEVGRVAEQLSILSAVMIKYRNNTGWLPETFLDYYYNKSSSLIQKRFKKNGVRFILSRTLDRLAEIEARLGIDPGHKISQDGHPYKNLVYIPPHIDGDNDAEPGDTLFPLDIHTATPGMRVRKIGKPSSFGTIIRGSNRGQWYHGEPRVYVDFSESGGSSEENIICSELTKFASPGESIVEGILKSVTSLINKNNYMIDEGADWVHSINQVQGGDTGTRGDEEIFDGGGGPRTRKKKLKKRKTNKNNHKTKKRKKHKKKKSRRTKRSRIKI